MLECSQDRAQTAALTLQPFELGLPRTELRCQLVAAVLGGHKTATSSLRLEYEPYTSDQLPRVGQHYLLLDFDDLPVGVVETTEVRIAPAGAVDVVFAKDEGEGFTTVAEWRAAHERYWAGIGLIETLDDTTEVVCERFRLVKQL